VLWNATAGTDAAQNYNSGLFCCLPGQTGTQVFECADQFTIVGPSLAAVKVGQPVPTGAAGVTVLVAVTGTITTGTAATVTGTTTSHQGIVGVVSSLIHGSTGAATYPRVPVAPAARFGLAWVGIGVWAVGVATFALFAIRAWRIGGCCGWAERGG
jgi:hypothetical protein